MISEERIKTNHLLLNELDYWEELDIKNNDDPHVNKHYREIMQLINQQLDNSIEWLDSQEAKDYFYGEMQYQKDIFELMESQWDRILNGKYDKIEDIINEVYDYGKIKGYQDIQSRIRYTEADKLALTHIRNYNFKLIRKLDNELRRSIKNQIFQGVMQGENPNNIASKLVKLGVERLPNSTLSPRQRAVMIAKTEVSRAQNTGILQSYVNEGYEEVKILTAEDDNVCYICLKNAYEFNDDAEIIYSNHGKERVHNIQEMIKKKEYVPAHPNCRCTYLSVWKRDRVPPEKPYTTNLINEDTHNWSYDYKGKSFQVQGNTPMSRDDFLQEYGVDVNNLDFESKAFIVTYTDDGDRAINNYLRGLITQKEAEIIWNDTIITLKNKGIIDYELSFERALKIKESVFKNYAKTLEKDIIVCRREIDRFMGVNGATKYNDKGCTSTSIHEYAKEKIYGDELNYILIPKGTKVLYVEELTRKPEDYEILFPPGIHLDLVEDVGSKKKIWRKS